MFHNSKSVSIAFCLLLLLFLFPFPAMGGLTDRVVASVDNHAITLSEFRREYEVARQKKPWITEPEVINAMINRKLIIMAAKKYRIDERSEDGIMREYIDLKIRAFVRVTAGDVESFYRNNADKFEGKSLEDVSDKIEQYLTEQEINGRLRETIEELRKGSYIRIQLEDK